MPSIRRAALRIRQGGVVVFATESFYALGADATNWRAVAEARRLKGRDLNKPIAVIASDLTQVEKFFFMTKQEWQLARQFWPGSLTIVLKPKPLIAARALGAARIGVRVPKHDAARKLARALGRPVTATSANHAGKLPTKSARIVKRYFPDILIMPGRCGSSTKPSTVVAFRSRQLTTLRPGAVYVHSPAA